MKKLLTVLLPVAVLTGVVAPKIVGTQLESSLDEVIAAVNVNPVYSVEVKNMESSWFSTSATFVVNMDISTFAGVPGAPAVEHFLVEVNFNASHGPFRFGENPGFGWLGWTAQVAGDELREHLDWAEDTAFYQAHGNMNVLGDYRYHDSFPSFTTEIEEHSLAFSGYQGEGEYQNEQLSYRGSVDSFTATSEAMEVKVENLTMDMAIASSLEQIFEGAFYDSDTKMNFATIKFNNKVQNKNIDITDLYVKVVTGLNQEKQQGNMQFAYGTKKVAIDEFYGEDLALEFEVNNISSIFIKSYQDFSLSLTNLAVEEASAKAMEFMAANLLSLVSAEPQMNITSIRGTFPQGSFNSNLHTSLVGITALPPQLQEPAFWLSHALVDGKVSGDKAVIEFIAAQVMKSQLKNNPQTQGMSEEQLEQIVAQQVPTILQSLEQQGLLVATDKSYSTNISLKNSEFKVNEKPIPLPF